MIEESVEELQRDVERATGGARPRRHLGPQFADRLTPAGIGKLQNEWFLGDLDEAAVPEVVAVFALQADARDIGEVSVRKSACFDHESNEDEPLDKCQLCAGHANAPLWQNTVFRAVVDARAPRDVLTPARFCRRRPPDARSTVAVRQSDTGRHSGSSDVQYSEISEASARVYPEWIMVSTVALSSAP